MIIFDVLIKRKPSLDQLRKGLETLGMLDAMKANPESMKKYFVSSGQLNVVELLRIIKYADGTESKHAEVFTKVLKSFNTQEITKFLTFVTGMNNGNMLLQQTIWVQFIEASSIFVATCTYELNVPLELTTNEDLLKAALIAVMDNTWKESFNTF